STPSAYSRSRLSTQPSKMNVRPTDTPPASRTPMLTPWTDPRMGVREAHDAGGAHAQEPAHARQGHPRAGPDARKAREAGEDADPANKDERQERADGRVQDPGQGSGPHAAVH